MEIEEKCIECIKHLNTGTMCSHCKYQLWGFDAINVLKFEEDKTAQQATERR